MPLVERCGPGVILGTSVYGGFVMKASYFWRRMPRVFMLATGLVLIFSLGAVAFANGNSNGTVFYGCLNTFTGALLKVNTKAPPKCGWGEQNVTWNQTGVQGQQGPEGKSAYQVWLDAGNQGTEQDFFDSLKGADGTNGVSGREVQREPYSIAPGDELTLSVQCTGDKKPLSGGVNAARDVLVFRSQPTATGWEATILNENDPLAEPGTTRNGNIYVICASVSN